MSGHLSTADRSDPGVVQLGGAVSLERRLPLLLSGFLAAGVAVMLGVTYLALVQSAEDGVRDRLLHAVREVAGTVDEALLEIEGEVGAVARDDAVTGALLAARASGSLPRGEVERVRDALARLERPGSGLPVELWDARGRRLALVGPDLPVGDRRLPAPGNAADRDAARVGPLHPIGAKIGFWVVAPVMAGGERLGYVVQPRYAGGPRDAVRSLRELLREEVSLYIYNADGTLWMEAPATRVAAPARRDTRAGGAWHLREGTGHLAATAPIARAPWVMAMETPHAWVLRRPRTTVLTLALVGALLTLVGTLLSWRVSRRITRPLATLTAAAEAVARGRYERRVRGTGSDEIGRLAASFDVMTRRVAATQQELERQVNDAQAAAEELEAANGQLRAAMHQAENLRREAERARSEAEVANRAKSDFLAVMSHELRTPLNAIAGYVEILEMGIHGPVNPAQREALARIGRSQTHLLTLINDVLNFARIDAGQVLYSLDALPVHETLSELEELMDPQVRASGVVFRYHPCEPTLFVRADRDKIRQVMLNLLGNAVKYTPRGGSITLRCEADEHQVRIQVRDTGTGIRPERLPHIFEAFVQAERALNRPDEGVGLGLAISRELARGMGGEILVESEVSAGSTFTLVLPRSTPLGPIPRPAGPGAAADAAPPLPLSDA